MTLLKDPMRVSARHDLSLGETLSVVGLCLDEETRRFLDLIAGTAPVFRVRRHIATYREVQDQDSLPEQLGSPAPELLRQGVLILHFAIGGDMAANAKHGRGTRNQIKKTAGFFVEAKAHHRQSLTEAQIVPG